MPRLIWQFLSLLLYLCHVCAQNISTNVTADPGLPQDPYLQYRPEFARSLPVQILLTGVVTTLVIVLLINLIFTAQYHWPLAQVNYILQISGVSILLISLMSTIHVVFAVAITESQEWPYMLSYIAVNLPPSGEETNAWTVTQNATWYLMNASTSGLIQVTHIQFLTLLYPSRLEGRLIFCLLGPLAIFSAVAQLVPIQNNPNVTSAADAVRNVCNATLSLLFTTLLFIWGLFVNRRRAWRTDGGTAAFGAAALTLAVASTALNFLYVPREEEYLWLPGLMWAVVLWQSFLGWWWWAGAGSGSGLSGWEETEAMEDKWRKIEKKERKRKERLERRRQQKAKMHDIWQGVSGTISGSTAQELHQRSPRRTSSASRSSSRSSPEENQHEPPRTAPPPQPYSRLLPTIIRRCYSKLRLAHETAAREQAVDRVERIREIHHRGKRERRVGWGLGSFAMRLGRNEVGDGDEVDEVAMTATRGRVSGGQKHERTRDDDSRSREGSGAPPIPNARARGREGREMGDSDGSWSMWWWGPLRRWRLQDSTSYH